ncbi:hypothetical protein Prudu_017894 [Prunus dulcis]|uniref:Uncharacterized protein n=1 Tax=Prunus dulcis TaxID=3755 RepID=A0A4Y1RPM0_PRUDU|nr:hypothetical protein Prudu_017894 [Prunus dulcis]
MYRYQKELLTMSDSGVADQDPAVLIPVYLMSGQAGDLIGDVDRHLLLNYQMGTSLAGSTDIDEFSPDQHEQVLDDDSKPEDDYPDPYDDEPDPVDGWFDDDQCRLSGHRQTIHQLDLAHHHMDLDNRPLVLNHRPTLARVDLG